MDPNQGSGHEHFPKIPDPDSQNVADPTEFSSLLSYFFAYFYAET